MDYMDIDHILDVPDTPDRLAAQNISGRGGLKKESNPSVVDHSEHRDVFDEGVRDRLKGNRKLVIEKGSKRLSCCPPQNVNASDYCKNHSNSTASVSRDSSSSKNGLLFRRRLADKTANHESKDSVHLQQVEKGKGLCTSHSSAYQHSAVVDLTEHIRHAEEIEKAFPSGLVGNIQAKEMKGSTSANGFSSLTTMENSPMTSRNSFKGKEKVDVCNVGASFGFGKGIGITGDSQPKAGKAASVSVHSITSPRVTRQKRLVRNGCISPHNIVKAKQSAEKHDNGPADVDQIKTETLASQGPPNLIDIKDLIAEENDSQGSKGKGVMNHRVLLKEPGAKAFHSSGRSSTNHNEKANANNDASQDAFRCLEVLRKTRSTRNGVKNLKFSLSDDDQHLSRGKGESSCVHQQHCNRVVRRNNENGSSTRTCNDCPKDQDLVSSPHGSTPLVAQTWASVRPQLHQHDEGPPASNKVIKRQRQGSTSRNRGECSTSAVDDPEIVFLDSPGESLHPRSYRTQSHHGIGILDPVIELDEFSPEGRHSGVRSIDSSGNNNSGARARQVEADELLARELQEQLYNEIPGVGVAEIDAHVALALQQEEDTPNALSSGNHPVFQPRSSLIQNLRRQLHSRSSRGPIIRRGSQARVTASSRVTRLRGRFPGQSRTISSRERNSMFPQNMDVEMRMHILEALEAFSDSSNILQAQRDFNENDYEMLLALDENNHRIGASLNQINGLPQSTVQNDNFEEDCAICLEIPTTGDTIRHLPCLHKFHKDCIDPWLRRKTSCPVCKSSITLI